MSNLVNEGMWGGFKPPPHARVISGHAPAEVGERVA